MHLGLFEKVMSHESHEFRCHEGLVSPTSLLELILQLLGYSKVHEEEVILVIHNLIYNWSSFIGHLLDWSFTWLSERNEYSEDDCMIR